MLVAVFQLALVTWIPVADAVHHSGDHPVSTSSESGGGHEDGSALAPVCFICAAGLGAFAPGDAGPTPAVSTAWSLPFEVDPGVLPATLRIFSTLPRGPPLA